MRILLSFAGFQDPFAQGLVEGQQQPGPILSLLQTRSFHRLVLFGTPRTREQTAQTVEALSSLQPRLEVDVRHLPLDDPTDYQAILRLLRPHLREVCEAEPEAELFVSVASGTPQMHACWLLLAASGELPARVLQIRPPRFVTREKPLVTEVDLGAPGFPEVRPVADLGELEAAHRKVHRGRHPSEVMQELGLVADHPLMRKALETASTLAPSEVPILILGETGTGKELVARFIHRLSGRPRERFVALNCGAIPRELVESTLFGHTKGAFTGATQDRLGKFEQAHGGTLFLDEVGELPPEAQTRLLRVLQDGVVERVGDVRSRRVDVRIVAATNRDLAKAMDEGRFREDLYFRLSSGVIELPPLRRRRSDIPKIALYILDRVNATLREPKRFSQDALRRLQAHSWRGNVRQLENVIERSVRLCPNPVVRAEDLLLDEPISRRDPLAALPEPAEGFRLEEFLRQARRHLILRALEISGGNQSQAARLLGVTPQAIHRFVKEWRSGR
jgi:DNA-binding NtrC family response regulator